jgi:hypothetical protein
VLLNQLPESLKSIKISLPPLIDTVNDIYIRQRLQDDHRKIIEQYKSEMMTVFIKIAEAHMAETQKLFDKEMAKMCQDDQSLPVHLRFTQIMLNLIESRLANMNEKVQCIYKYKMYHFFDKDPRKN